MMLFKLVKQLINNDFRWEGETVVKDEMLGKGLEAAKGIRDDRKADVLVKIAGEAVGEENRQIIAEIMDAAADLRSIGYRSYILERVVAKRELWLQYDQAVHLKNFCFASCTSCLFIRGRMYYPT